MNKKIILLVIFFVFPLSFFAQTISTLPYGIDIVFPDNEVLQKIKEAGITWIYMELNWAVTEPHRGEYDFSHADRIIDFADRNGISILAKIAYTPGWANKNKGKNYPATDIDDWRSFVQTVVRRYKDRVKFWAIWNEPNLRIFFAEKKDAFVRKIFLPAAQTIRQVDPSAWIVGPELAHLSTPGEEWYFWLKYILQQCGPYIDVVSHHIYDNRGVIYIFEKLEEGEAFLPAVKKIVEESGAGNKPFWITETGWDTRTFTETKQSEFYLEMLKNQKSKNFPTKLFFYQIIDDPRPDALPFGILRSNNSEKPAFQVYRDFIAGKYPDDPPIDTDPKNKKCYALALFSQPHAEKNIPLLARLRHFRDGVAGSGSVGRELIGCYYSLSGTFIEMAHEDPRIARLSCELFADVLAYLDKDNRLLLNRKLKRGTLSKIAALAELLAQSKRFKAGQPLLEALLARFSQGKNLTLADILQKQGSLVLKTLQQFENLPQKYLLPTPLRIFF